MEPTLLLTIAYSNVSVRYTSTSPCQLLQLEPSFTTLLPPAFAEMLRKIRVMDSRLRGGGIILPLPLMEMGYKTIYNS
jgi:hypothetical protein